MKEHEKMDRVNIQEEVLVRYCAPTLAGLKTGSIFTVRNLDSKTLGKELRAMNRVFVPKGLRMIPLRLSEQSAILYVYRPDRLWLDLQHTCAQCLLEREGYELSSLAEDATKGATGCLIQLIQRMRKKGDFPHEIGLFLGYPPHDVQGFMNREECVCVGCWKVYAEQKKAEKTFARFHKCQSVYEKHLKRGRSVDALTVSGARLAWKSAA